MPDYGNRLSSEVIWLTKDYRSTTVTLYKEDYEHIIGEHPNMKNNGPAIKDTIADPDVVYRDKDFDNRASYYKRSSLATYASSPKNLYTYVVLEAADRTWTDARVVTAFPKSNAAGRESDKIYERDKEL